MFFVAVEAKTYRRHVGKLRFFFPCFEYQDLFILNRIVHPSVSYLSQKVMSEVSISRRRRSPSAWFGLACLRVLLLVRRILLSI
jgi:hypothetical protein